MIPFPYTYSEPAPPDTAPIAEPTLAPEPEHAAPQSSAAFRTGQTLGALGARHVLSALGTAPQIARYVFEVVQWLCAIGLCIIFPPFGLLLLAIFIAGLTVRRP